MELRHINEEEFDKLVKNSNKTVLVDFFATWCGPCKMLTPILEGIQDEVKDNVDIFKVDIDECMDLAKSFGIMSVPTMIVFKGGEEVNRLVGLRPKNLILQAIK